jgi:multidrug efflux system membrane fusion protein
MIMRKKTLVTLLAAVLVAAGGYKLYRERHPTAAAATAQSSGRPLAPVVVAPVTREDLPVWLTELGTVTPVYTVTLKSRVDGELIKVNFKEGDIVKAGTLLAEIDPRPFQVQLDQALGQKAHDEALLQNARLDLERYRVLAVQGAVPQQQLDTQQALVQQYEASIVSDQAQVDNAGLQLVYCRITAPVTGRLGLRQVDPGNIVHAADTNGMVVITQISPITVIFPIPQDQIPLVLKGLKQPKALTVEAWDRANATRLAEGTLMTLDNQIDTTTGMVKLRAQFANADGSLFPNQFVNARLHVDTLKNAVVVPTSGVQQGNQGPYAYVVNDKHVVSVRKLKVGQSSGDKVSILEGLNPGEQVVVDGVDNLRDGITVEISAGKHTAKP